ncbi:hypothetical protein Golob_008596, partial [Gossypium lobatum]|nr:hypothetical protein [Gossypium lobatum]
MQGGGGEFDTITKAIKSVPSGNTKRRSQKYAKFDIDGTAKQYGTIDSATLITECSYFMGANLNLL